MASKQRREGEHGVGDDHKHAVEPAAEVPGNQPEEYPGEDRQHYGDDDDRKCRLGAPDHSREHVVAADGRAQEVITAGRLLRAEVAVLVFQLSKSVRREKRRKDRCQ